MSRFFDPQRMRPYRPDYVSIQEHARNVQANAARKAVVQAARMTIKRMEGPTVTFVKRDDAQFATSLTEAQKVAAKLAPAGETACREWAKHTPRVRTTLVA